MRSYEFISEDAKTKNMVIRTLNKMPDDASIFPQVYKQIVGEPLTNRIVRYIEARKDPDAIQAANWLVQTIPTLGSANEVKEFIQKFQNSEFDPIDTEKLTPPQGMSSPANLLSVVTDPFSQKLFLKIFQEYQGKGDAGPGEAALAILSPKITYTSPGDIIVGNVKVEVKASKGSGKAGRIWDTPLNQDPMIEILAQVGLTSFTVLDGERPFPDTKLAKKFIRAACIAWFKQPVPEIERVFGQQGFRISWQKHVFDTYKEHGKWDGMLAIGVKTYQYITSGVEFAVSMNKAQQGVICRAGAKQSRELAPQVQIF